MTLIISLIAFACSLDKSAYHSLLSTPARQTGVLSCAVILCLLWQIKAGILPQLNIHILGITAVSLTLGLRMGTLSVTLAALLHGVFNTLSLYEFANFWLFSALLPCYLSYFLFLLCYTYLPRHFFVYIFVCAFIFAGTVGCLKILSSAMFFYFEGLYTWPQLADNYLHFSIIMWFPEAMLNGMAMTLLITYKPHWVKTFYDKDYLDK
ncbi:energy-coupling factor ABC transporter permease [Pseudoalteromonas sp. T1lg65]|uniref:energy-coupling factor ABC transporter permease n=1 Tax=Pseudoalteromonas sp. T1lg65 TaxID=2077101 RepID=UPI003F7AA5AD